MSEENVKLCFVVTLNNISCIVAKNFFEIHQVSQKIWIFTSSIWTVFVNFLEIFTFTCYKKTYNVSI